MGTWFRPVDSTENNIGINDSSYYTFRDQKYESLAREIAQNSLDERLNPDKPVKIEFNLFELNRKDFPDLLNYTSLYEDGLKYWKDDSQDNAKKFFQEALNILSKKTIRVMRISDFNTNGVLGAKSDNKNSDSARDLRPWQNLLKSEGSSSKGGTQGGSFGIGKNATFAVSSLRTVIYSTYDKEEVKAHEGVSKLATVKKDGKTFSAKSFYGDIKDNRSRAIDGLIDLDPNFKRTEFGTDIYVMGFETDDNWEVRIVKSLLLDFMIPIKNYDLEISLATELINKDSLGPMYDKYIGYCANNRMKSISKEFQSAKNYYSVLVSGESKEFVKEFDSMGKARLKVLYNPEFERKVMRTRETGMKLFDKGGISSSIGFSGIVRIEGEALSKLFREMETPAHDKWSADNIIDADGKKEGEKRERELNRWLKEVILENATSQKLESMEVIGLSDYLPMQAKNSEEEEEASLDKISSNINEITVKKVNREKFKSGSFIEEVVEIYGAEDELGDDGGIFEPTGDTNELAGGKGTKRDKKVGEGSGTAYKKIRSDDFQVRLIRQEDYYLLKLKFKKTYEQIQVHTFISGENNKARAYIKEAENSISSKKFEHDSNIINVGRIDREELSLKLHLMEDKDYSLEVEIYEIKQQ